MAMKHRRNVLKAAKGYRFGRSKKEVEAKVALRHAGAHAFAHRKDKKTDMRRLFTVRLNAALRENGVTYSRFIALAKAKNVQIDRKILSILAAENPTTFKTLVTTVTA
jgi:large subunit ribosomal protein L20